MTLLQKKKKLTWKKLAIVFYTKLTHQKKTKMKTKNKSPSHPPPPNPQFECEKVGHPLPYSWA